MKKNFFCILFIGIIFFCTIFKSFGAEVINNIKPNVLDSTNNNSKSYEPYEIRLDTAIKENNISLKSTFPRGVIELDKISKDGSNIDIMLTTFVLSIETDAKGNVMVIILGNESDKRRIPAQIKYLITDYELNKYNSLVVTYYDYDKFYLYQENPKMGDSFKPYIDIYIDKEGLEDLHYAKTYEARVKICNWLESIGIKGLTIEGE